MTSLPNHADEMPMVPNITFSEMSMDKTKVTIALYRYHT